MSAGSDGLLREAVVREVADCCGWTLAELADRYLREGQAQCAALREAFLAGDAVEVARHAHGWAGASATAGVIGMEEILIRVERAAKQGDLATAEDVFHDAESRLVEANIALRALAAGG